MKTYNPEKAKKALNQGEDLGNGPYSLTKPEWRVEQIISQDSYSCSFH